MPSRRPGIHAYAIATYSGVSGTYPAQWTSSAQDTGTTYSATLCASPACAANSWTAIAVDSQRNVSASSNTTARTGSGTGIFLGDSNGPVSGSYTMSTAISSSNTTAGFIASIPPASSGNSTTTSYIYGLTGYANPDAPTSIGTAGATTTYAYDANGNLVQSVSGATTTTYVYSYANRLMAFGTNGATTTYGYDYQGSRVFQAANAATTTYPSRYLSIFSTLSGSTTNATTTKYVWSGDTLIAYLEQALVNGTATGTEQTYYVHPDNLGSVNVLTNASGTVVSTSDYYPFGSIRSKSGTTTLARGYIDQFSDMSGLVYLNARYYEANRGQFLSEDPVFLGNPKGQILTDPQSLNSYSYSNDNPINKSDPTGLSSWSSWLSDPLGSAFCSEYLGVAAGGAQFSGRPATAELLAHSLSLNPGPINAGNGSVLVNSITSNSQYQAQLQAALQSANSQGLTSINQTLPLNFTQGDAYTAFGKVDLNVAGTRNKNGAWQVSVSGSDVYDFSYNNYGGNKLVGSANNLAYFGQGQGTVSNFTTNLNFTQTVSGGGARVPSASSLWTTPSGAVVTFGGQLVSGPSKK